MTAPIRLGIVGVGKIARDQHLPALAASSSFDLVAAASRTATVDGIANFASIEAMLAQGPAIDAVSICTPPQGRDAIVAAALDAGKHVMLEKPPGETVSEVLALARHAEAAGVTLFTSWHSRAAAAVGAARGWLARRAVRSVAIAWRENIQQWHPGQDWILAPGGFGVFDPGINALSIATAILPGALAVRSARLDFPANCQAPIAADVAMTLGGAVPVTMALDFLQTGEQTWEIVVEAADGRLVLSAGGAYLAIDGAAVPLGEEIGEYRSLYRRFAQLVRAGESEVDVAPLQLVADAFLVGERATVDPFSF